MNPELKTTIDNLPQTPGVYQYFDQEGILIYIGKAKNLKRRVSSYFNKNQHNTKTQVLVKRIHSLKYMVVPTEEDALHLENSLIKQFKPRYNVMLKDDKSYPWLCICREHYPRLLYTRRVVKDGSNYFGPYSNVHVAKLIHEMIHELYTLRTCSLCLQPEKIAQRNYKVCLQYHIKKCKGPCEELQTETEYNRQIEEIRKILKGETHEVRNHLHEEMQQLASELRFEEAAEVKRKYDLLDDYQARSVIVSPTISNVDVISYTDDEKSAYINWLHVVNGSIVQGYTFEYKKALNETQEELLGMGIVEIRQRFKSRTREIIVPFLPEIELTNVIFTVAQRGDKRRLIELSYQNAKQYKLDKLKHAEQLNPEQRTTRILTTLQKDLQLNALPIHIECFDNSNIQGTNAVAACVVFKKAKPCKKEYRHFNIKTVEGPDDFASMVEIITRRYKRLTEEDAPLPQLIVIDGGKGQLHAAVDALKTLGLYKKIAIIGIAKRLEEIYFPEDPIPIYLDKNSESLRLIQQLRDEAHRFGITFHRQKRSKEQVVSALDSLKGVGIVTKEKLLRQFKSLKRIKELSENELTELMGKSKGKQIYTQLHPPLTLQTDRETEKTEREQIKKE